MQAILSNAQHPEYGEVTIPFPIGENEYGCCLELLGKMEIGNPIERIFPTWRRSARITIWI